MIDIEEIRQITNEVKDKERKELKIEAALTIPRMENTIRKAAKHGNDSAIFRNMFHLYDYIKDYFEPLGFKVEPFIEPYDIMRISW